MVVNESLGALHCGVVVGAFEILAFQKVTVEPNGTRAVFWHCGGLPKN
jgi:hypothetical protein